MSGHVVASVERYLELSGKTRNSLKPVSTPCIDDHQLDPADDLVRGELKEESAKIVLKALYVARINRTDLLWAVNSLAREVTIWSVNCDKRLHRLICYMHFSVDMQMECWVGDDPKDCQLALFADASFASWLADSKSTSGCILVLMGPNTYVPISWFCKKQSSTSNSSTESELISLDAALRMEGIPALSLWELIIDVFHPEDTKPNDRADQTAPKPKNMYDELSNVDFVPTNLPEHKGRAKLVLLEDNDPVIQICIKGRNPTLRHVPRVHRVNTDACYERIRDDPGIFLRYWPTKYQLADILTKGSFTKLEWDRLVDLLQIRPYKRTQKEKDVQAMISQPERFQIHYGSDDDAASIPTIKPNHKNRKNIKSERGKQYRSQEVGGINSY